MHLLLWANCCSSSPTHWSLLSWSHPNSNHMRTSDGSEQWCRRHRTWTVLHGRTPDETSREYCPAFSLVGQSFSTLLMIPHIWQHPFGPALNDAKSVPVVLSCPARFVRVVHVSSSLPELLHLLTGPDNWFLGNVEVAPSNHLHPLTRVLLRSLVNQIRHPEGTACGGLVATLRMSLLILSN